MEEVREGNTAYQQGHCTGEDLALTLCMIAITLGWVSLLGSVLQRSTFPSTAQIPVEKVAGCIGGRWLKAHPVPWRLKKWLWTTKSQFHSCFHLCHSPNPVTMRLMCAEGVGYVPKCWTSWIPDFRRFLLHFGAIQPQVTCPKSPTKTMCVQCVLFSLAFIMSTYTITSNMCASCFFPLLD